jgi:surfeit locus 1 family protein
MLREYSFRPRGWALALAAAGCTAFMALGNWQSRRADEKRAAAAHTEQIVLKGEFVPARTVLLDNRLRHGRPGYEVITPLRLSGSQRHVLVNRGWIAAPPTRERLPEVRTPPGEVRVEGIALERLPHALEPGAPGKGPVRQNLDRAAFAAETGLQFEPRILEQHSALDDGLARDWPRAEMSPDKHQSYALQWYSLAALSVALFVILSFHRVAKT